MIRLSEYPQFKGKSTSEQIEIIKRMLLYENKLRLSIDIQQQYKDAISEDRGGWFQELVSITDLVQKMVLGNFKRLLRC